MTSVGPVVINHFSLVDLAVVHHRTGVVGYLVLETVLLDVLWPLRLLGLEDPVLLFLELLTGSLEIIPGLLVVLQVLEPLGGTEDSLLEDEVAVHPVV